MIIWDEVTELRHRLKWAHIQIAVLWGCLAVSWVYHLARLWFTSHGY